MWTPSEVFMQVDRNGHARSVTYDKAIEKLKRDLEEFKQKDAP